MSQKEYSPIGHLFELSRPDEWDKLNERLTERQRRLAIAAMSYHALLNPDRELEYRFGLGRKDQYPRLTDGSSLDGVLVDDTESLGIVHARGVAPHTTAFPAHYCIGDQLAPDPNQRFILLTPDEATDADVRGAWQERFPQRVYDQLERTAPAILDVIREQTTRWRLRHLHEQVPPRRVLTASEEARARGIRRPVQDVTPGDPVSGARPAVIVGMHWLQTGGAERWAIETVELVKQAGLLPIVITDHESQQPWITRPEMDGALVLPLTFPSQERAGDEPLLRALIEAFDLRGVLVHHSQWLYDRLPQLKRFRPQAEAIDNLHIIEYTGGGFPAAGVHEDRFIDEHLVISPQLSDWLTKTNRIDPAKVVLAPLSGLTVKDIRSPEPREASAPFVVSFVGRLARQKRPDAFLLLARRLMRENPRGYRFILHGDGEMNETVAALIARLGLASVLEWRRSDQPVRDTLGESDLLVITSRNEGITLTTFEATAAGVPVLSTDVGSQRTVIPSEGLLPRGTARMVSSGSQVVQNLAADEALRLQLWSEERRLIDQFTARPSATEWMRGRIDSWA
ncbi:glycosyltransferase [Pseudoclavibacter caeni]|jgi:glycosyltransferase involved in cell wall biosynthesis|uniref:Glycosyltransferase family 4 protein n=1 Tax=Pseudoclavibacter caeni TaxID=908846 RepID=A0A7C8BSC4_9MICO|nr:glycosyltransferase [Pseudoclavibacter caeni]KAB1633628.1 glycosyltransferase family 4 protein [Pseudoclavibacter caeni]NYJ96357.1 glycosyltransferase involved in cell wall biosynthesis [Pseudoclavibacter caeni]